MVSPFVKFNSFLNNNGKTKIITGKKQGCMGASRGGWSFRRYPSFVENIMSLLIGPAPEYKILDKKIDISRDHPLRTRNPNLPNNYPSYNVVIIDGVEEIVEHKKMEPI